MRLFEKMTDVNILYPIKCMQNLNERYTHSCFRYFTLNVFVSYFQNVMHSDFINFNLKLVSNRNIKKLHLHKVY